MAQTCEHLDMIEVGKPTTRAADTVCVDCIREGTRWVHLRECLTCGQIRCCDSSPRRHASAHARNDAHPIASSIEPGEDWSWCYVDEVAFVVQFGR
jgi:CPA1 family monovalent cation:H+ antiporter